MLNVLVLVRLVREGRYRRSYLKYRHSTLRPAARVGEHVTHNIPLSPENGFSPRTKM